MRLVLSKSLAILFMLQMYFSGFAIDHLDLVMLNQRWPDEGGITRHDKKCLDEGRIDLATQELAVAIYDKVPIIVSANLLRNLFIVLNDDLKTFWKKRLAVTPDELEKVVATFLSDYLGGVGATRGDIYWTKRFFDKRDKDFISKLGEINVIERLQANYNIFATKDNNLQFLLLLPKKIGSESLTLESAGFDSHEFDPITDAFVLVDISKYIDKDDAVLVPKIGLIYSSDSDIAQFKEPLNISRLKGLFSAENLIPKRIYLMGHGKPGLIAYLNLQQYEEFLKILNDINCECLFVTSCYAGGTNLLEIRTLQLAQQEKIVDSIVRKHFLGKGYDVRGINYILVVASTQQSVISAAEISLPPTEGTLQFKEFFSSLDSYLKQFSTKQPIEQRQKTRLMDVLKFVIRPKYESAPIARYPGGQDFFWVTEWAPKVGVITHASQVLRKALLVAETKGAVPKVRVPEVLDLSKKRYVYVYPAIIDGPVILPCGDSKIISMIQAKAVHIFSNLIMKQCSLLDILNSWQDCPFERIYVVEKLVCKGKDLKIEGRKMEPAKEIEIEKLFVHFYANEGNKVDVYFRLDGSWYTNLEKDRDLLLKFTTRYEV